MSSTYTKQSDSAQRVSVQSRLIYAVWLSKAAYGGAEATLEVRTSFVGDGAPVKLKGRTEGGKNLGSVDAQIFGNRLVIGLPIPEKVPMDDLAYVEVKLPKHGLQGETNRIPTRQPIAVKQIKWSAPEARRGDVLTLTCEFQSQVPDDTAATVVIYEYSQAGYHDPICKIPTTVKNNRIELQWQYEYQEDTAEIPTNQDLQPYSKNYRHPEYFFVVSLDGVRIGAGQESSLLKFKDWVEIECKDEQGKPLANGQYTLTLPDGSTKNGKLDAQGKAVVKDVPPGKYDIEFKP